MSKTPVAYLRKSRVVNDRHLSWEIQEQKVRELADQHGENGNLLLLSDWNRSGGTGKKRPGYRQLLSMIEADQVSALYGYNLSRLSRSISDFTTLAELCVEHNVPIRLAGDRQLDFGTASGRFVVNILASVAQMQRELASESSKDTVAVRRARGDRIGHPFYGEKEGEDVGAVLQAYKDAGSVVGAGRLLNERGVPTRSGRPWSTTPVRQILERHLALPVRKRPGAKNAAPFILFHLVRCHCGRLMSASRFKTTGGTRTKLYTQVVYRCIAGRTDPKHSRRLNITESKLLPWVKEEAARLSVPADAAEIAAADDDRRLQLEARRRRVLDNYEDGLIDKAERDAKLLEVGERLAAIDAVATVVDIPQSVPWDADAMEVNAVLRSMWRHIQLDDDLQPVAAEWIVPEWRR